MLFEMQDERIEKEEIQEAESIGNYTCHFSVLLGKYDKGLGDHPVVGFSVRTYMTETPDKDGVAANFDSFLEARAYYEYAKKRVLDL
ncbi:hypothetical protein [Siccibacter colletis]|uniref:hypothetical protein n=1 Tax=Siccibacter colletis TaxID=1505757 RepID=UPI0004E2568B|nr:hypothetical protein [Siccibacter colletis]